MKKEVGNLQTKAENMIKIGETREKRRENQEKGGKLKLRNAGE